MMKTEPVVFVLHDTYHIMVPTTTSCMMWAEVDGECYYDESNGILRSGSHIHRMIVPKEALDSAKAYTIYEEEIIERKAYFSLTGEVRKTYFEFQPVQSGAVRCYHIADAHNREEEPSLAAKNYGDLDFLILNGDIPDSSDKIENFESIYRIAASITHGKIPVVFARGNHDMRGVFAETIADYTPNENGKTYYTFRLGDIWGIVLDCGEDKEDSSDEYGHTVCCHPFRLRQTKFIEQVISHAEDEYESEGIRHKIVIVHNPFTFQIGGQFSIEEAIYTKWASLLKEKIKPDVMICGHLHRLEINEPGCERDHLGQPCTVVVGAKPGKGYFAGAGFVFDENGIKVTFNDNEGKILEETML